MSDWCQVAGESAISTPALLLHSERVDENVRRMVALAGGPEKLRPHIKTHKLGPLIQRQMAIGITKFKCATIAEAELCARSGARDILLAQQLVGPHAARFAALARAFPQARFSTMVDNAEAARQIAGAASGTNITLLVDLDIGQHRTGIAPDEDAATFYAFVAGLPNVQPGGLHAYDGHLHQRDPVIRRT
ncbi:MAG: family PLP-dependent enzyme, partial [Chthoniobacteraceae bacterium]|nr:family PLP-dependent enzyme [Chthoniobacteraceae bacterium]